MIQFALPLPATEARLAASTGRVRAALSELTHDGSIEHHHLRELRDQLVVTLFVTAVGSAEAAEQGRRTEIYLIHLLDPGG
jgi:hypothetical protein